MKLLIVTQYFWPESFKINDMVSMLSDKNNEITVLTGIPNYPNGKWYQGYGMGSMGRSSHEKIDIIRVPIIPRLSGKGWQLAINYLSYALSASIIGPLLYRGKPDIIFVYEPSPFTVGIPAMFLRALKRSPLVFWVQDLWPESLSATGAVKSAFVLKLVGWMVRKIYQSCDHVLVQSEAFIKPAVEAGAPEYRISYFPNWAEDFYQPVQPPAGGLGLPNGFMIMFAGNMGAAQSLGTIVNAAARLKGRADIRWIMIGDGRRRQWMMEEVERQGLQDIVIFVGRKPAEEMPQYFSNADALLATLTDEDIFSYTIPAKVQSYLACGKPLIVALNGEGARIVSESGGGFSVPAGDAEALAEAAYKMYSLSEERRELMGNAALEYSRNNFDRQRLVMQLESLLKDVSEAGLCAS